MLESGVVLSDALEGRSAECRALPLVIRTWPIASSRAISSALAQYPSSGVSTVKASEASGNMRVCCRLSGYLNADADTRKQSGAFIRSSCS